ncbi:hypothetical protein AA309_20125 [Microvirga vignae]|uniref:Uncharacterized protein n=1 Tax=Microvirga vignae TaxID=1225564 RepID=A0A0H1R867_9HYPH|nr:hypothetical protein AA309_20125 [Microvirga vignae]
MTRGYQPQPQRGPRPTPPGRALSYAWFAARYRFYRDRGELRLAQHYGDLCGLPVSPTGPKIPLKRKEP